jgi:hypothetical protein
MQKKHAHIILEEEKATLNLCTKFSNTHLKIFRTVIIFIYHARHRDGSSRITFLENCFKLKIDLEPFDGKVYSGCIFVTCF